MSARLTGCKGGIKRIPRIADREEIASTHSLRTEEDPTTYWRKVIRELLDRWSVKPASQTVEKGCQEGNSLAQSNTCLRKPTIQCVNKINNLSKLNPRVVVASSRRAAFYLRC